MNIYLNGEREGGGNVQSNGLRYVYIRTRTHTVIGLEFKKVIVIQYMNWMVWLQCEEKILYV